MYCEKTNAPPGPMIEMEGAPAERAIVCGNLTKQRAILLTRCIEKRYPKSDRSLKMHCPMEKGKLPCDWWKTWKNKVTLLSTKTTLFGSKCHAKKLYPG